MSIKKDFLSYVQAHGIAQLFFWSAFYYLLPALSAQITTQTQWPVLHVSTTYTLAFLTWAFCAPWVGLSIDRGYGARVMHMGGVVGVIILLGLSQVSDRWIFSFLVVALGACMAATLYDPCFALLVRRLKDRAPDAISSVTLYAGFATLLTFPMVLGLSLVMTWQSIALVFAGLASLAIWLLPMEPALDRKNATLLTPHKLSGKAPILIALSFGMIMLGHAILLFLLPTVLAKSANMGNAGILSLAVLGPTQIVGRLAWKAYGDAIGPLTSAMVLFALFCLPPLILLASGYSIAFLYTALALQGACYGVHTILRPVLASLYLSVENFGRGLGGIATVGLLMMAIGPALGGFVWSIVGFTGLMILVLILNLIALGLIAVLVKLPRSGSLI